MTSIYKELSYNQEIDVVRGIQFSILGSEEIKQRSAVEVTKSDTFTGNEPVIGGLFDPRMGVLEHNKYCSTCEQKNTFCPGHFGHIVLARPVFQPMFFDQVRKLLKCVCFRCSRPLVSKRSTKDEFKNEIQKISLIKNPKKKWDAFAKLCGNTKLKRCGDDQNDENNSGCLARQPTRFLKESSMKIIAEWKDTNEIVQQELTAEDILRIFKRITEEDMELMGYHSRWNRPEWLLCSVLQVPPPAVRPSIIEESGQRREDDLTHKLSDIIKYNNQLKERIESGKGNEDQLKVLTNLIQYHIATFMDNQIPGLPVAQQRNGRKLKSIADRLKKKEGRIRGNLNGKRVDQSARSVITPDPYISADELGVPIKIAMNITFSEIVNKYNFEEMQKLVRNGPNVWPGAKYVRLANGITITLKYADREKIASELVDGDIVDRHVRDGDYVLFNRQPSLHKMSMMCHKTKIMPYQTFRLPVLCTAPYNADFDGDEMNKFMPQNVQTMSELMDLAAVPYMIIAPRDGKPIVEVVQDSMVGAFRITKDWVKIHDKTMANLQMVNSYFSGKLPEPKNKGDYHFSGKQAYSQILPPSFFFETKNKSDEKFKVYNSEIISGTIDKTVYHSLSRGIIAVIYHDYSPFEVRRFLDNTQRLICRWLTTAGFSVGISDLVTDKDTQDKLEQTISMYKGKAYSKIQDVRSGHLENNSIFTNEDFFEREILNVLNELTNQVGKIGLQQIDEKTNRMINMVKSGSKGKETNVAQMIACVGQQNVDGKRVAYGFTDRTLPHYTKYDDGPEARGFVENSFISGLSPQEVFFHAMGGREGLIDTAVKSVTADTVIVIIEDKISKTVKIGEWIDSYLDNEKYKFKVEHSEVARQELLNLDKKVYIPTTDEDGNITWGELTAITRHDPTENIYKIKTLGGRDVTVAESKSLLIWNKDTKTFNEKLTTEVKMGDYVPVTMNLVEPPIIQSFVDMSIYFPKDKYIHDGCIYPHSASRDTCRIPDKFILNYENGIFIGLFLANGHADIHSGQVIITKEDESIKSFVKSWFDKYAIKHKECTEKNLMGTTTTISGYSTLLGSFLNQFVGSGSKNKYVPDVALIAPEEFVKGILTGYFSGDGNVKESYITSESVSRDLIEGISLLCNRLGIYCEIKTIQQKTNNFGTQNILPMHTISIHAQWARIFSDKITLLVDYKNNALKSIKEDQDDLNYPYQKDVVLDMITDIEVMHSDNINKLYDVTVPSTLNFSLRNGIHMYDTSETGYIQRRLVKAMEDNKIYYDQTVRNAAGVIVQYLYGEDGIDGTKIENQYIPYIDMNLLDIDIKYHLKPSDPLQFILTNSAYAELEKDKSWVAKCTEHYNKIVEDKQYLINNIFKGEKVDKIQYPIPFDRILKNAIHRLEIVSVNSTAAPIDLTPAYVLEKIEYLIDNLKIIRKDQGIYFLHILLRLNLSPKPLIIQHRITKAVFDWIVSEIERYFMMAIAQAGEMVGIIAAQSIGELGTQQTLDSFHSSGTAAAVKATSGVPRLKELLSVSKNIKTPTLIIYMKPDIGVVINPNEDDKGTVNDPRIQESKERCMKVMQNLEITRLSDILESTEIYWDPPGDKGLNTGIEDDTGLLETYRAFQNIYNCSSESPWVLRMKLDKSKMYRIGLTMLDIYIKIYNSYSNSIECLYSDDNANQLIFRIRLNNDSVKDLDKNDAISALKAMEHNIVNNILLKGVKGIKKVSMRLKTKKQWTGSLKSKDLPDTANTDEDHFEKIAEWILDTDGTNLSEILANPNIDSMRTRSNDIYEVYQTLGIEAARNALYYEFMEVVGEGAINYRHMSLLLDTMTNRGTLMSVDRHGINRGDVGPLAKSSFEETTDMLINASIFSEHDKINGVSANIMLGQLPPCGTGDNEILLDETEYIRLLKDMNLTSKPITKPTEIETQYKEACDVKNIAFTYNIPEKQNKKKFTKQKVQFI